MDTNEAVLAFAFLAVSLVYVCELIASAAVHAFALFACANFWIADGVFNV